MPRLRLLLAAVLVVLACLGGAATAGAAAPARAGEELAVAAGAFVDSVGVNVPAGDAAAGWALADRLRGAGIRHVRGSAAAGPDDPALAGLRALAGAELQLDLVVPPGSDPGAVLQTAVSLGAAVAALEVPATADPAPLRRAVRAHPRLPGVTVLGQGAGADYQAVRLDLGGRCPGCVADQLGSGDGAVQVTEATVGAGVPATVAARYLQRLLLANAGLAVRTYLDGRGAPGTGPGLLDGGGSPTPAWHAVARLVALLDDRRLAEPGRLAFRLSGATDGVRHRLLQKSDGHFWLALWVEKPGWDPVAGRELAVPGRPVRVSLGSPVAGARAFVPELGTDPEASFADPSGSLRRIDLELTDRVLLLELLPERVGGAAPSVTAPPEEPAAPTSPVPAPVVAAASQTAPTTTAPAAGAGRAAAAGRPTPSLDPASRSPLAFTGSTALSMLAASMLLVLVGVVALFASRRRYHHRH